MNSDSLNMVSRLGEGHMPCNFFSLNHSSRPLWLTCQKHDPEPKIEFIENYATSYLHIPKRLIFGHMYQMFRSRARVFKCLGIRE